MRLSVFASRHRLATYFSKPLFVMVILFCLSSFGFGLARGYGGEEMVHHASVILISKVDNITNVSPVPMSAIFSEDVKGFTADDVKVTNAALSNFKEISAKNYSFDITPIGDGIFTVNIPENAVFCTHGYGNMASDEFLRTYDSTHPKVAITSSADSMATISLVKVTIKFDEDVEGFDAKDVVLVNGTLNDFVKVSKREYLANVLLSSPGNLSIKINSDACFDQSGNGNDQSNTLVIGYTGKRPGVVLMTSSPNTVNTKPILFYADISKEVTDFTIDDIWVKNGFIASFKVITSKLYEFEVIPEKSGSVIIGVNENVAHDRDGNGNTASLEYTIEYKPDVVIDERPIIPKIVDTITKTVPALIEGAIDKINVPVEQVPNAVSAGALVVAGAAAVVPALTNTFMLFSSLREILFSFWNSLLFFLGARRKQKQWGKVIDAATGIPIPMVKVKLDEIIASAGSTTTSRRTITTVYTDKDGNYGFVAPPGQYELEASKENYQYATLPGEYYEPGTIMNVKDYSESLIVPVIAMTLSQDGARKKFGMVRKFAYLEKIMFVLSVLFLLFGTAVTVYNLIYSYEQSQLFVAITYALLWIVWIYSGISRRSKSPWGEVVDGSNQKPLPLSIIRVMDETDGKPRLIRTVISDQNGKFSTLLSRDKYKIVVSKPGYTQTEPIHVNAQNKMNVVNKKIVMLPQEVKSKPIL